MFRLHNITNVSRKFYSRWRNEGTVLHNTQEKSNDRRYINKNNNSTKKNCVEQMPVFCLILYSHNIFAACMTFYPNSSISFSALSSFRTSSIPFSYWPMFGIFSLSITTSVTYLLVMCLNPNQRRIYLKLKAGFQVQPA